MPKKGMKPPATGDKLPLPKKVAKKAVKPAKKSKGGY